MSSTPAKQRKGKKPTHSPAAEERIAQNWVPTKTFWSPRTSRMAKSITRTQGEDCRQGPPREQKRQMCQKPEVSCLGVVSGTESGRNCPSVEVPTKHKSSAYQDPPMGIVSDSRKQSRDMESLNPPQASKQGDDSVDKALAMSS